MTFTYIAYRFYKTTIAHIMLYNFYCAPNNRAQIIPQASHTHITRFVVVPNLGQAFLYIFTKTNCCSWVVFQLSFMQPLQLVTLVVSGLIFSEQGVALGPWSSKVTTNSQQSLRLFEFFRTWRLSPTSCLPLDLSTPSTKLVELWFSLLLSKRNSITEGDHCTSNGSLVGLPSSFGSLQSAPFRSLMSELG